MSHRITKADLTKLRTDVAALGVGKSRAFEESPLADTIEMSGVLAKVNEPRGRVTPHVAVAVPCAAPAPEAVAREEQPPPLVPWWRSLARQSQGWLTSATLHAVALVALGLMAFSPSDAVKLIGIEMAVDQGSAEADMQPAGTDVSDVDADAGEGGTGLSAAPIFAMAEPAANSPLMLEAPTLRTGGVPALDDMNSIAGDNREIDNVPVGAGSVGNGQPGDGGGGTGDGDAHGKGNGYAMFYGQEAKGQRFAYVVDSSGSMTGVRFEQACTELMSSIVGLNSTQSFYVVFFNSAAYPQFYPDIDEFLTKADGKGVDKLARWMRNVMPGGFTNPAPALEQALKLEPDAVFFLSDGEFDVLPVLSTIKRYNTSKAVINTIAFGSLAGEPMLMEIAQKTGGKYTPVLLGQ